MKKRLTALLFAAAMLTGCADSAVTTEPQTGSSQQESDASATASSTTSETTSASTEKTTTAAPEKPETPAETKLTAEQLFGGRQIKGGEGNEGQKQN